MPQFEPEQTPPGVSDFVAAYLEAAEWLLAEEIDRDSVKGWAPEAIKRAEEDCADFQEVAGDLLEQAYNRADYGGAPQAGHDFWLTRNRHGAGFWDRGALQAERLGDRLSDVAKHCGSCDAYQGDDGYLYFA